MKGRPEGSIVRNRIIHILKKLGTSYGYEIYKIYKKLFGKIHIRSIYYNLKKGIEKEEIIVVDVVNEVGDYSWGNEVEKVYYAIGPYAKSTISEDDKKKINGLDAKNKGVKIDWEKEIKTILQDLKKDINNYEKRKKTLLTQGKKLIIERINKKYEKILEYGEEKLGKEKIKNLTNNINPPTP